MLIDGPGKRPPFSSTADTIRAASLGLSRHWRVSWISTVGARDRQVNRWASRGLAPIAEAIFSRQPRSEFPLVRYSDGS
jgi:hypothetical protein